MGTPVRMAIDPALRELHMKIHSAGHLIDLAVERLSIKSLMKSMSGQQERAIISLMVHMWNIRALLIMQRRLWQISTISLKISLNRR